MRITCSGRKLQVSSTENPGTGPPIEDGIPVGPSLGAVLSKFCYVVLVSKATMMNNNENAMLGGLCAWHWLEAVPDLPWQLHTGGAGLPQVQVDICSSQNILLRNSIT